jgi:hypothetical protein
VLNNPLDVAFLETSALNGTNIDKGFEIMINEIYDRFKLLISEEDKKDSLETGQKIKLEDIQMTQDIAKESKKKKCCK